MIKGYDYHVLSINLALLSGEREYNINGGLIQFISGVGDINIRLNSNDSDQIPLTINKGIQANFERFYLSSSATGTIKLYVSSNADIKFIGDETNINTLAEVTHVTNIDGVDLVSVVGEMPFSQNIYGGKVTVTDASTTLINTSNKSKYKNFYIINDGISDVWLRDASPAIILGGICIRAGQSRYFPQFYATLFGICDTGESTAVRLNYSH